MEDRQIPFRSRNVLRQPKQHLHKWTNNGDQSVVGKLSLGDLPLCSGALLVLYVFQRKAAEKNLKKQTWS
jgi:hypothetical protein